MPRGIPNDRIKTTTETIEVNNREVKVEKRERRGGNTSTINRYKFNRPEFERDGYNRYWPADVGIRIQELYDQDYDFVLDDNGQKIKQFGGFDRFGNKFDHYLMEKPKDWYDADKKQKLEEGEREQLRRNNSEVARATGGLNVYRPDVDKAYGGNAAFKELD